METIVQDQQYFSEQKLNERRNVSIFPVSLVSIHLFAAQHLPICSFVRSSMESNIQFIIQQCAAWVPVVDRIQCRASYSSNFLHFSYFPKNSTQEILDEIYPKLYPLDTGKICGAFDLLAIFLNPMQGYELWLDDLINLWNTYHNPSWNEVSNCLRLCQFKQTQNLYFNLALFFLIGYDELDSGHRMPECRSHRLGTIHTNDIHAHHAFPWFTRML